MPNVVKIIRLSEDESGESHFDEYDVAQVETPFAPPALPFMVAPPAKATAYTIVRIPAGWVGQRHRSPHRQMCFCYAGALKVTASDGTVEMITPGRLWLMTDVTGKGHESEVVSDVAFEAALVFLD